MSADERTRRESIQSAAKSLREASRGKLTQTQAEARVRNAVRRGDRERANNNR
ncbi:MAG: hypothetical protein ACO3N4_02775 [Ilumatobacteraceae bacterium]|jgi:hypothetical protein